MTQMKQSLQSRFCLACILLRQRHSRLTDQLIGNRLIKRESQIAFFIAITSCRLYHRLISRHWRIDTDMFLERRKLDERTTELEGGHLVADGFRRIGHFEANELTNFFHNLFHLGRDFCEVVINAGAFRFFSHDAQPRWRQYRFSPSASWLRMRAWQQQDLGL